MKYPEMWEKVMSPSVTLDDWKRFKKYHESLPRCFSPEEIRTDAKFSEKKKQTFKQQTDDFVKAACHVAMVLTWEEICQDPWLVLA